jgi:hypothetical protein
VKTLDGRGRRRASARGRRILAAVIASAALLVLILWVLPLALTAGPGDALSAAERLRARNDVRSTLVTLVAALVAVAGLTFTGRTYLLNVSGQVTDRYSKAVGQLGEKEIAVRVGAIYALERIARDSPRDTDTIVEVLCTFVRAARAVPGGPGQGAADAGAAVPPDVQAALTVLGRVPLSQCAVPVDLRQADLRGVDLTGAMLDGAWFRESLLTGARLRGTRLRGAWLSAARLDDADLDSAVLEEARLREAVLDGAILKGARLAGADLEGASLRGTWLAGAHLSRGMLTQTQQKAANGVRNVVWE